MEKRNKRNFFTLNYGIQKTFDQVTLIEKLRQKEGGILIKMQTLSQANPTINLSTNTNGLKIDIVKQFIEQFQD